MTLTGREGSAPRQWVSRKNLGDGAWQVRCILCGKRFTHTFRPERSNDPKGAASDYVGEHLGSAEHAAAIEAYREPPVSSLAKEEMLLRAIFGEVDDQTPEQMRRSAARIAAERTMRSGR